MVTALVVSPLVRSIVAAVLLVVTPGLQADPVRGSTAQGADYAMGGVSIEELQALERHKDRYSLWITLAAKGSGAYLADVQIRITDARKQLVFNEQVPGPWLMIDLPPGRYTVEALRRGQPQTRSTQIHANDRHQMFFYFDVPVERSPEWRTPFETNPYGR